jgi:hypothetical protein
MLLALEAAACLCMATIAAALLIGIGWQARVMYDDRKERKDQ